jgi:hypothetical protein
MRSFKTTLQRATEVGAVLCVLALLPAAYANSITAGLSLINTDADGSVTTPSLLFPADSSSFDLTGGNLGNGLTGLTEFTGTAASAGIVQFVWSYTSCDPPNQQPQSQACDTPGFDWTGYLVDQNLIQLTDTDTGGLVASANFAVSAGSVFGWYVGTFDNFGGPGTVTVSDISFTPSSSGVPEPGTMSLCMACILVVAAVRRSVNTQFRNRRRI